MEAFIVWTVVLVGVIVAVVWVWSEASGHKTIIGSKYNAPPTPTPNKPKRLTLWQRFVAWM